MVTPLCFLQQPCFSQVHAGFPFKQRLVGAPLGRDKRSEKRLRCLWKWQTGRRKKKSFDTFRHREIRAVVIGPYCLLTEPYHRNFNKTAGHGLNLLGVPRLYPYYPAIMAKSWLLHVTFVPPNLCQRTVRFLLWFIFSYPIDKTLRPDGYPPPIIKKINSECSFIMPNLTCTYLQKGKTWKAIFSDPSQEMFISIRCRTRSLCGFFFFFKCAFCSMTPFSLRSPYPCFSEKDAWPPAVAIKNTVSIATSHSTV